MIPILHHRKKFMQILAKKCWHMHLKGLYHMYVFAVSFSLSCFTIILSYSICFALNLLRLLVQYLVLERVMSWFAVYPKNSISVFVIHVNLLLP